MSESQGGGWFALLFVSFGGFEWTPQDCSPGHTAKEDPHLVRTGASRGYSRAANA